MKLNDKQRAFLEALATTNLSAPTGNPPVLTLAKAGLIRFLHRSDDLSIMAITDAGRAALAKPSRVGQGSEADTADDGQLRDTGQPLSPQEGEDNAAE